jgi:hypothetical protein
MGGKKKIILKPKPVFTLLSVLLGMTFVLLLPLLYRILLQENPDGLEFKTFIPDQIFLDGILGALAGVAFAVFSLFRFDEALLVKLIRLFLLIILSLSFLTYITIKSII